MRRLLTLRLVLCFLPVALTASDTTTETAVVQQFFDAMAAHDGAALSGLFTPEATVLSIRPDGASTATPQQKWVERVASSKDKFLERMWNPKVLDHGSLAVVWADYDFHLNGVFHHCGIDSFTLIKTTAGWKIAGVAFTSETQGCSQAGAPPAPAK
ncbi:MAG TPA: DUF4440 domain-containing protein [Bryobacteraceae bacterium]|nr:DUF4440 domain-containing protein [Bryobacteraceae bacterium]